MPIGLLGPKIQAKRRLVRLAIDNAAVLLTPHPGDANNDGAVNVGDLGVLAGNWGWTGAPASGPVPVKSARRISSSQRSRPRCGVPVKVLADWHHV
jgi:hypothetical protein